MLRDSWGGGSNRNDAANRRQVDERDIRDREDKPGLMQNIVNGFKAIPAGFREAYDTYKKPISEPAWNSNIENIRASNGALDFYNKSPQYLKDISNPNEYRRDIGFTQAAKMGPKNAIKGLMGMFKSRVPEYQQTASELGYSPSQAQESIDFNTKMRAFANEKAMQDYQSSRMNERGRHDDYVAPIPIIQEQEQIAPTQPDLMTIEELLNAQYPYSAVGDFLKGRI